MVWKRNLMADIWKKCREIWAKTERNLSGHEKKEIFEKLQGEIFREIVQRLSGRI